MGPNQHVDAMNVTILSCSDAASCVLRLVFNSFVCRECIDWDNMFTIFFDSGAFTYKSRSKQEEFKGF